MFKILEADTRKIIPLRFNEAQLKLYQKYKWFREHRLPVRIIICKSRRAGLSTGVSALIYDDTVTHPNTTSLIVANERNPSENVLGMYTRFWSETPEAIKIGNHELNLRPPLPPQFRNNPPKDRLVLAPPLDSKIFVASARSLDAYLSFGFQNVHATEASRYVNGTELFRALYPTISKSPHSALYVESTPNGQDGPGRWFFQQCMDAAARKKGEYGEMALVFVPWHEMVKTFSLPFEDSSKREAFERSLNHKERDYQRRFPHITLEQLRWYRMIMNSPLCNNDEDLFDQEFPSDLATSFISSGTSVFGRRQIKRLMQNVRVPIWEGDIYWGDAKNNHNMPIHNTVRVPHFLTKWESNDKGFESHVNSKNRENLKVFRWPRTGDRVFIACDVGGGDPETKDGDESTMAVGVLNELEQDELIMTWRGHINPVAFAEVAAALAWGVRTMVGENVTAPEIVPEWTGPGIPMCTYLDTKNLYPNLYHYQAPGVHNLPKTKHIGWESNAKTKPIAVKFCLRMVEQNLIDIPDEEVVMQMSSYRQLDDYGDSSSYGGATGRHDDLVSALQILCAVMRIRSSRIPGESSVDVIEDFGESDENLPAFDPFHEEEPSWDGYIDEENAEETLWYGSWGQ